MRKELLHAANPWRVRLTWVAIYLVLMSATLGTLYIMLERVRTFSLPTGGVELSVPYSTYLVGETVSFTVKNDFNSPIYVNNSCPSEPLSVYRQVNGSWLRIHDTTAISNCATQDRTVMIPPNSSMTATFANWPHLFDTPGNYRVVMMVQYYNALPYQDFQVIAKPTPALATTPPITKHTSQTTHQDDNEGQTSSPVTSSATLPNTTPSQTTYTPQTYTLNVTSAGIYSPTSFSMHAGDSLKIVYTAPYTNEVITRFTPTGSTSTSVSSVTVDSEFHSRSRTFPSVGTWSFKAEDHNGNTGTISVLADP